MNEERPSRAAQAVRTQMLLTVVTFMGLGPAAVNADIVQTNISRWNTLIETTDGSLSNGGDDSLFAGWAGSQGLRRGLLRFDVASIVPAGSTITAASLQLRMTRTITGPELVTVHRVLSDWGQGTSVGGMGGGGGGPSTPGDATWLHTFWSDQFWTNPGGDFDPTESAAKAVGGNAYYTFAGPGLLADVQAWVDDPAANFGWLLKGNEEVSGTAKRFAAGSHSNTAYRPLLVIEYTPVPGAPTAALLAIAGVTSVRRRRAQS